MDKNYYIDNIKFQLTGNILENELEYKDQDQVINISLQEMMRYYDSTNFIQVPGDKCIDLGKIEEDTGIAISSVSNVYRTKGVGYTSDQKTSGDPVMLSLQNTGGYGYGSQKQLYNYLTYSTTEQIANTLSTDLFFQEDIANKKLYINYSENRPAEVVIEYIPKLKDVDEVKGEYQINILMRLSLAYAKMTLGRIRTRYKQTNALQEQDGETLLSEGKEELKELRERLQSHADFSYPLD